jgi:hypothetical protein
MNNTVIIDLVVENAVNIGSDYSVKIRLCDAPDLQLYSGFCQIRANNLEASDIVISPLVTVLTKDLFEISINYINFNQNINPGNYQYDVLFMKIDNGDERFYPVGGKVSFVQRITRV